MIVLSMPYFYFPTYVVGSVALQTWGTLVALGILVATYVVYRKAKKEKLPAHMVWDFAFWIIVFSFIGARLGHVLLYEPAYYFIHPADILRFWLGGFSSFGGFIGGAMAGLYLIKKRTFDFWQWSDVILFGLPIGWAIGRIGCFFTHEHPGKFTNFFLGVRYPDGVRHDLGLYDAMNAALLALVLFLFRNTFKKWPGAVTAFVLCWYGIARFFLDFLRATDGSIIDARYAGLTPGQYGSMVLIIVGVWIFIRKKQ